MGRWQQSLPSGASLHSQDVVPCKNGIFVKQAAPLAMDEP